MQSLRPPNYIMGMLRVIRRESCAHGRVNLHLEVLGATTKSRPLDLANKVKPQESRHLLMTLVKTFRMMVILRLLSVDILILPRNHGLVLSRKGYPP